MNKCFQIYKTIKFHWIFFLVTLFFLMLAGCTIGGHTPGSLYPLSSRPLSLNNSDLRTCVFDPVYSIVHFPMYHYPADGGHLALQVIERTTQSQFQLLHTILDYNRARNLLLFDEHITTDDYDSRYFQALSSGGSGTYIRIDGKPFQMREEMQRAQSYFSHGIPNYYEHLSPLQKDFLFDLGASLTLFLLGKLPKIHKVITPGQFELVRNALKGPYGRLIFQGNDHWVYDFRELELKKEVLNVLHRNRAPRTILLIAYGANHDLSDEFSGFPFQSGHSFCLDWSQSPYQPVLP